MFGIVIASGIIIVFGMGTPILQTSKINLLKLRVGSQIFY
jgi:hypothetical protein